jgi:Putative transposase
MNSVQAQSTRPGLKPFKNLVPGPEDQVKTGSEALSLLSRSISAPVNVITYRGKSAAQVSFRGKDYACGGKQKVMTLSADEFLRRFLIHVLPRGLVRIRQFGLFANHRRAHRFSAAVHSSAPWHHHNSLRRPVTRDVLFVPGTC